VHFVEETLFPSRFTFSPGLVFFPSGLAYDITASNSTPFAICVLKQRTSEQRFKKLRRGQINEKRKIHFVSFLAVFRFVRF
jgi:hypothetical protein